jgi:hypothetical protein
VQLGFAQLEAFGGAAAEWILQESFAARRAQIKPFFAVRVVAHQCAVFIEFVVAFEDFVKIGEVIAIFVDPALIGEGRSVQLHL